MTMDLVLIALNIGAILLITVTLIDYYINTLQASGSVQNTQLQKGVQALPVIGPDNRDGSRTTGRVYEAKKWIVTHDDEITKSTYILAFILLATLSFNWVI